MRAWPGNTSARRATKRIIAPILSERAYSYLQAISMARDIRSGALTEDEIQLIPHVVQPGDTVVDIGANYGMWVYPLSRAVERRGRVWAFEPVPFTVATLRKVISVLRLKNVEVIAKGSADKAGSAVFEVPIQDNGAVQAGQAHFASRNDERPGRERHARWINSKEITCETVAVDDVVPRSAAVSFIKLDIEGAELSALRGCREIITRWRPTIVCEINPWFLDGLNLTVHDLTTFFDENGYGMYRWTGDRLDSVKENDVDEGNYVFVHPMQRPDLLGPKLSVAIRSHPRDIT